MWKHLAVLAMALAACGGSGGTASTPGTPPPSPPAPIVSADITLLFMGNSHTSVNNVPGIVADMVRAARPGKTVQYAVSPEWMFLEERASDPASLQLLGGQRWSFVVLQAQKYSSSGMFVYSIDGAVALALMARAGGAIPILFPEWPRRGFDETQRIYDLHVSIARREPACVAPIGQAWDLALSLHSTLELYASDGNHSAPAGAFLAALILATTMTGFPPDQLPALGDIAVEPDVQALLRRVAAQTSLAYRPRQWCPTDP